MAKKIQGLLTSVRPRASPNREKPLYANKTVEMNRYILCTSSRQVVRLKRGRVSHEKNEMSFVVQAHALINP